MANEVSINVLLSVAKGGLSLVGQVNYQQDMDGNNAIGNVQIVGTAAEALVLGDVSDPPAAMMLVNQDPTNFVVVDSINTMANFTQKIMPGKAILLAPETNVIYAKADTAPVNLYVLAVDP